MKKILKKAARIIDLDLTNRFVGKLSHNRYKGSLKDPKNGQKRPKTAKNGHFSHYYVIYQMCVLEAIFFYALDQLSLLGVKFI